MMLAAV